MNSRAVAWLVLGVALSLGRADAKPPHGNAAVPGPPGLTLLSMEEGVQGTGASALFPPSSFFAVGGNGTFTGSAPASMTATVLGCGGGSLAVDVLTTPSYGAGTYQVLVAMPSATGTGCTITVTDNFSRTATSPPFNVISTTPGATQVSNIHDAPGWAASHAYTPASGPKTRVVNGAGWTGSAFVPGSALNAYELTSGSCTSASSGGPSGTGGLISDGTCTWKYLSGVDYLSESAWNFDGPQWASGHTYSFGDYATTNVAGHLRSYSLSGSSSYAFCTSTVAPSGVGSGGGNWGLSTLTTSDGCQWEYMADLVYSSQVSYIPEQSYVNNGWGVTAHLDRPYTGAMWNDAEYVAGAAAFSGAPAERNPLMMVDHAQNRILEGNLQGLQDVNRVPTITVATGEGFASNLTTATPLAGYDPTKGVAIRNPNSTADSLGPNNAEAGAAGFLAWANFPSVIGLQIKATAAPAVMTTNGPTVTNNILDGGFKNITTLCAAVWMDNDVNFVNNLVLSHGCIGVYAKYGNSFLLFNTIVNVGTVTAPVAIGNFWCWCTISGVSSGPFQELVVANNAFYNWGHLFGENPTGGGTLTPLSASSANNVTDLAGPDNTGTTWYTDGSSNSATVLAVPGTTFSVSGASMFVNPASDYRPNTGISTAGASFGNYNQYCSFPFTSGCVVENYDTPDILGNARPNGSSQFSTGAEQHP